MRKLLVLALTLGLLTGAPPARAAFTVQNTNADGFVTGAFPGDFTLTGGSNDSSRFGRTTYAQLFTEATVLTFFWTYTTGDSPGLDPAGYFFNSAFNQLSNFSSSLSGGPVTIAVGVGDTFGWYVSTLDNVGPTASLAVTGIASAFVSVPAPSALAVFGVGLLGFLSARRRQA